MRRARRRFSWRCLGRVRTSTPKRPTAGPGVVDRLTCAGPGVLRGQRRGAGAGQVCRGAGVPLGAGAGPHPQGDRKALRDSSRAEAGSVSVVPNWGGRPTGVSSPLLLDSNARDQGLEARVGIEPTSKGFADLCLTTWLPRQLQGPCRTPVPWSGRRDSNPRHRPWQGRTLPTELLPLPLFSDDITVSPPAIEGGIA